MSASQDTFSPAGSWHTDPDDDDMDFEVRASLCLWGIDNVVYMS